MKKRSFLMAAFAAMFMAGCSDNEMEKDNGFVVPEDGVVYTKISIAMPGNGFGGRALGGFEDGVDVGDINESTINSLLLVFYDKTGHVMGNTMLDDNDLAELKNTGTDEEGTKYMYGGVVEVQLNPLNNAKPSQLMVYANPQAVGDHRSPLAEILTKTREHARTGEKGDGYFTMNNSVYYDGNKLVTSIAVSENDFYDSPEKAQAAGKKTKVYLERMAAKVNVVRSAALDNNVVTDENTPGNHAFQVNANRYLVFQIDDAKWGLSGKEKQMFLIKNLPSQKPGTEWNWVWADSHRTCWARSYSYRQGPNNSEYSGNQNAQFPLYGGTDGDFALTYLNYTGAGNGWGETEYCLENTGQPAKFNTPNDGNGNVWNPYATTTNVLIVGTYKVTSDARGTTLDPHFYEGTTPKDFYYWGSDLYLEDEIKNSMVNSQIFIYTDQNCGENARANADVFVFGNKVGEAPASHYFIQVEEPSENLWCKYTDATGEHIIQLNTPANLAIANKELQDRYTAMKYAQGKAFFSVPIEHRGKINGEVGEGTYGVVRNHSYHVTINTIKGLANGVDGNEDLIPEPAGQTKWWVGADIHTLKWHVVTQDVNL